MIALALAACAERPVHHASVVLDRSDSLEDGAGSVCGPLAGIAAAELADPRSDADTVLEVWVTGSGARANAPDRLFAGALPAARRSLEGRRRQEEARRAFVEELAARCRAAVAQADRSPIADAVDAALAGLRARCGPADDCRLWVVSDGQETELAPVRARIAPRRREVPGPLPALDAAGVEVHLCGWALTRGTLAGPSTADLRERTAAVWAELLAGERSFASEPACPG